MIQARCGAICTGPFFVEFPGFPGPHRELMPAQDEFEKITFSSLIVDFLQSDYIQNTTLNTLLYQLSYAVPMRPEMRRKVPKIGFKLRSCTRRKYRDPKICAGDSDLRVAVRAR